MTCDCDHIWNYSVEIGRSHEATRNLEQNIEAVCVAADAINLIVSNAEVSRFAAGLSRGKSSW